MSKRNNLFLGLLAGASFAFGYWLNSDRGRTFRQDAADTVNDAYQRGQESAMDAVEKTSEMVNEVIDSGVDMMKKAKDITRKTEKKAKEVADS
ncbi:MAG: hypothetical protein R3275_06320 [Saprospiraceae bacterium]|nr:hypothetical protein [Saprospiraceae bacterium]